MNSFSRLVALCLLPLAVSVSASAEGMAPHWAEAIETQRQLEARSLGARADAKPYWPSYSFGHLDSDYLFLHIADDESSRDPLEATKFYDEMAVTTRRTNLDGRIYDIRDFSFIGDSVMSITCFRPVDHSYTHRFCSIYLSEGTYSKYERISPASQTARATYRRETARSLVTKFIPNHGEGFHWISSDDRTTISARARRFKIRIRRP